MSYLMGLRLPRWYWNINQGENTNQRTTWWNERKWEGIRGYSKSKPDDFLRARYEHMMGGSGLASCRFLRLEAGRPPRTTRAVLELARAAPHWWWRYRHADGRYFGLGFEWTLVAVWQPITKRAMVWKVGSNGARWNSGGGARKRTKTRCALVNT